MQTTTRMTTHLAVCLLALTCAANAGADPVGRPVTPLFAMDTAIRDALHTTRESQVTMVAELAYSGVSLGLGPVDDLSATLRLLDARDLELVAVYVTASAEDLDVSRALAEAMDLLKGRRVCVWLAMDSRTHQVSSPAGDLTAVPYLRTLADAAAANGLSVSLYPHAGMWLERVEDALRVAEKVDRPNVGVTFNLCHWLKVAPEQDLVSIIHRAAPRLTMVSVNGADTGGKDWRQLIQTLDRGTYDVGRLLDVLREVGYDGPVGFQGFGIGGDAYENLSRTMEAWRHLAKPAVSLWHRELLGRALRNDLATYEAGRSRKAFRILEMRLYDAPPAGRDYLEAQMLDLLLSAHTTLAARRRLLALLGTWGGERSLSACVACLDSPETFHAALNALQGRSGAQTDRALRAALDRLDGESLVAAIIVVGDRRDAQAVDRLAALGGHQDPKVAGAALAALGCIGSEKAAERLVQLSLPDGPGLARAHALLRCANRLAADGKAKIASDMFGRMLAGAGPSAVRVAALHGRASIGGTAAVTSVLGALDADDPETRRTAAGLLAGLEGADVSRLAAERLPMLAEDAQVIVIAGLAQRGDRSAADALSVAARDGTEAVQLAAVTALGRLGSVACIPLLCEKMRTGGELGRVSMESLCRLDAPGVASEIMARLSDAHTGSRRDLIRVVSERHMVAAATLLIQIARQGSREEKLEALGALRGLATGAHFNDLAALLRTDMDDVMRSRLVNALNAVVSRHGVTGAQVTQLIATLRDRDLSVKPAVLEVLGRSGATPAFAAIADCLDSGAADVDKAAVRALVSWPDAKPLPLLYGVARRRAGDDVGVLALRGYVSMLMRDCGRANRGVVSGLQRAFAVARRSEDRQFVVDAFGRAASLDAVEFVEPLLADATLGASARGAFVALVQSLAGRWDGDMHARVQRVMGSTSDAVFAQQLGNVLSAIEEIEDCLHEWEVSGPYSGGAQALFHTAFPPEQGKNAPVVWRPVNALEGPFTQFIRPGDVNLGAVIGGENCVAYLRTRILSPVERDVVLEVGSDDGVKVWLNSELVLAHDAHRAHERASDRVGVHLREGWNALMLKVTQSGGQWGASARLRTPEGGRL